MANVVIVSKHLFFKENGFDYPMGMSASDILSFSNLEKAESYVAELIKQYNMDDGEPDFAYYEYSKEECFNQGVKTMQVYSQRGYNKRNVRTAFRIVKREIE